MKDTIRITYDELMSELEKYKRTSYSLTPDQKKALIDARDIYNITWDDIANIFSEKLGVNFNKRTLADVYRKIKKNKNE